jgi:hypothetical protein
MSDFETGVQTLPQAAPMNPAQTLLAGLGLSARDVLTASFEVKDPLTNKGTGLFIELAGPEHPERKRLSLEAQREARAAMEKQASETGRLVPVLKDPEENLAESLEMLVAATLNWYRKDGKPVTPFSKNAARTLYVDPESQWLVRQVANRVGDLNLFIKA